MRSSQQPGKVGEAALILKVLQMEQQAQREKVTYSKSLSIEIIGTYWE